MIVEIRTHVATDAQTLFAQIQRPALFTHLSAPLVSFHSCEPGGFPEHWRDGEKHEVGMRVFGFLPLGRQTINIDLTQFRPGQMLMRDRGAGQLAQVWDHVILIEPHENGALYQDNVVIKAGALTPGLWLFATIFFRWRQHRLRALARRGFAL